MFNRIKLVGNSTNIGVNIMSGWEISEKRLNTGTPKWTWIEIIVIIIPILLAIMLIISYFLSR